MAEIKWPEEAAIWLEDIHEYIARDNPQAAGRVVEGIYGKVQILSDFPEIGYLYRKEQEGDIRILFYVPTASKELIVNTRPRPVFQFHKPETLPEWRGQAETLRAKLQNMPDLDEQGLRPARIRDGHHLICSRKAVKISHEHLIKRSKGPINICLLCLEAYPSKHGDICRQCQGEKITGHLKLQQNR